MTATNLRNSTQKLPDDAVKSAARIWTDPMPEGCDEQVRFFQEQGFLIMRSVLGGDELDELDRELHRLAQNHDKVANIREGFDLEPNQDPTREVPTFRKIGGITDTSDAFRRLCGHPRIVNMLHAIMGDTLELYRDVCMMKAASVGREKPWHQDSSYWPWEPMSLVCAMTALDDATPENGCLQVIPGSHHKALQHYGGELMVDLDNEMQSRTCYVPLKPGDTLLFHSLLLHASEPNRSDQDRRVCILAYKTPKVSFIGHGEQRPCAIVSQR